MVHLAFDLSFYPLVAWANGARKLAPQLPMFGISADNSVDIPWMIYRNVCRTIREYSARNTTLHNYI